jgi:hypothetical protein
MVVIALLSYAVGGSRTEHQFSSCDAASRLRGHVLGGCGAAGGDEDPTPVRCVTALSYPKRRGARLALQ